MMGEERLNTLLLLYIHRDIFLDFDKIIDMYASKYPRRMLLIHPLSENNLSKILALFRMEGKKAHLTVFSL